MLKTITEKISVTAAICFLLISGGVGS